jgi:hypothetical protein
MGGAVMTQRKCDDCQTTSPETETQYTLIAQHGWRVSRSRGNGGETILEWRCPPCWVGYKARQPAAKTMPPPPMRVSKPSAPPPSHSSAEAGRLFDRAIEALGTKPPVKPPR